MDRQNWEIRITEACKSAGTYREAFSGAIETLAGILERRDQVEAAYNGEPTVEHTTKTGAVNIVQNPMIRLVNDLNRDALAYWRDLGLTPAGLKRINEAAIKGTEREPTALDKALQKLTG